MAKPKKRARKPVFEPTEQQRGEVKAYCHMGLAPSEIAAQMGIDEDLLRAHFAPIIATAKKSFLSHVLNSLGRQALGAPAEYDKNGRMTRDELKPNVQACIRILEMEEASQKARDSDK